jgi:DNA-binding CsgD family transcriptional regulator
MNCPHCGHQLAHHEITEKQRRRYELYRLAGQTLEQIAKIENISPEAVRKSVLQVERRLKTRTMLSRGTHDRNS